MSHEERKLERKAQGSHPDSPERKHHVDIASLVDVAQTNEFVLREAVDALKRTSRAAAEESIRMRDL